MSGLGTSTYVSQLKSDYLSPGGAANHITADKSIRAGLYLVDTSAGPVNLSLLGSNLKSGDVCEIICLSGGNNCVVTGDFKGGSSTVTMTGASGEYLKCVYVGDVGGQTYAEWYIVGRSSSAAAAAGAVAGLPVVA